MESLVLSLALLSLLATQVSARGTVVALYNAIKYKSPVVWVSPSPFRGSPLGCVNLPGNYTPLSGKFTWNAGNSDAEYCSYVIFYFLPNCAPSLTGGEPAIKMPSNMVATSLADFTSSKNVYANKVRLAVSVGCSFYPNPCQKYGCADPNAQCQSSFYNITDTSGKPAVSVPANTTIECSSCKPGYSFINGVCQDKCWNVTCGGEATCAVDASTNQTFCQCPDSSFQYNATSETCVSSGEDLWLPALNNLRSINNANDSAWSPALAEKAVNWAGYLRTNQCPNAPTNVKVSKIPNSGLSENDGYLSYSFAEQSALDLWVPNPYNTSNPRLARIVSNQTTQVGCGKVPCGYGAFFVCLFSPFTY